MTDNTERDPMSTLTDLLRLSSILHDFHGEADRDEIELGKCYVACECGAGFEAAEMSDAHTAWHTHVIAAQVAVVADWLESTDTIRAAEDAHPERGGSCCFNMGQPGHRCPPYVTSASMSAALAAEAQKGARRD